MTKNIIALKIHDFDCSVQEINKILGINATESWLKGEIIPNRDGKVIRKQNSWIFKQNIQNKQAVDKQILKLLESINPDGLRDLTSKYIGELSIVIRSSNNNIGLNFDKKTIALFHSLGLELDLDIYLLT